MNIHSTSRGGLRRYVHSLLSGALILGAAAQLGAHQGTPPLSLQGKALPLAVVQRVVLATTDVAAELAADAKGAKPLPLQFAVPQHVVLTPTNSGAWEQVPDGLLWRLRVVSTNATDLNFGFTTFWLPQGASLHIMAEDEAYYQGPYTAADNTPAAQLWTPPVPGQAAMIELFVPTGAKEAPRLVLTQVSTGYRDLFHRRKDLSIPKAGSCEIDVVCPQGLPWANEIRSVARIIIGGTGLCSGTLIMDAAGDFRPFFLTADHCGITVGNAASVVVNWNYESPTCGLFGLGASATNNQTGATFRAARADVDFCLIELNQIPSTNYHVYYAGWDRSGTAPSGGVSIHQPNGDGKCISFSASQFSTMDNCIGTGGNSTHWKVPWQNPPQGVTEPGSSGSGIWDSTTRLLVGTLSGGPSSCSANPASLYDCYGKFSLAWATGSTPADRLQDWLDPQNTGLMSKSGSDPSPVSSVVPAGAWLLAEVCSPTNGVADPGEVVTVSLALQNPGTAPTTNLIATLLATNGVAAPSGPQLYGALAASGAAVARSFTFTANGACGGTIIPTLQLQDGTRSLGTAAFSMTLGAPASSLAFSENFDGVAAPALPLAWASSPVGVWATTAIQQDTLPNSAFAPDGSSIADYQLSSPLIAINSAKAQLSFRHYYITESGYDGGVLEISINGGAFMDILTAGGSFASGGYSGSLSTGFSNPLGGSAAWTGNSFGFVSTLVNLPPAAAGGNIQLRWRLGTDSSIAATGWYVDTISLAQIGYACCTGAPPATLIAMRYNTNHQFQFTVNGGTGYAYAVLSSTNVVTPLSSWSPLITNTAPFTFIDSNSPALPRRFYRAQSK